MCWKNTLFAVNLPPATFIQGSLPLVLKERGSNYPSIHHFTEPFIFPQTPFPQLAGLVYVTLPQMETIPCVWSSFSEPFPSLSWGKVGGGMGWTDERKMTDQSWSIHNVGVRGYTVESVSALFFTPSLIIFIYGSVVLSIKLIFLPISNNSKILLPSLLFHLEPII